MDFFFSPQNVLSLCVLELSKVVLILIVVCHSNTTNFSTSGSLDNAECVEVEVKWFSGIGKGGAKLPWLPRVQHVVPASSPIAFDTPSLIKDCGCFFLSFSPAFFDLRVCTFSILRQLETDIVNVFSQWDSFLLNLIVCMCRSWLWAFSYDCLESVHPPFDPINEQP